MIRTVLAVVLLCLASFLFGVWWQAHPDAHPKVLAWAGRRFEPHCPDGWKCYAP